MSLWPLMKYLAKPTLTEGEPFTIVRQLSVQLDNQLSLV